ncbi:hypothetical protein [Halapricum desulfuricans]|uniref:hypothetical protein n=1 Tax=Halapricum desulfuricans TaxID=2841257 RepID=UPI001E5D638F|nr:hypothetical protein [Halapricum desulfuricans]
MLAGVAVEPWLATPGFVGTVIVKSLSYTFRGRHLNDLLPSIGRATVLSTASMVYGVSCILFRVGGGALAEAIGPKSATVGLAAGVAVLTQLFRVGGDVVVEPEAQRR